MRTWDLNAGAAKIQLAIKSLRAEAAAIAESWNDRTNAAFQETYLRPLEAKVGALLDAIQRLSEVLGAAERECRNE